MGGPAAGRWGGDAVAGAHEEVVGAREVEAE